MRGPFYEETVDRFAVVLVISFTVLGWIGTRIYQEMPPIPDQVVATDGTVVIATGDIGRGQNVWQSLGGMEVGSIWGHGSYVAPDWTADWLHREAMFVLEEWSPADYGKPYAQLTRRGQGQAARPPGSNLPRQHLRCGHRHDSHRPGSRARLRELPAALFRTSSSTATTAYAIPEGSVQFSGTHAVVGGLHLLDLVGRRHQAAERRHLLHQQLAA